MLCIPVSSAASDILDCNSRASPRFDTKHIVGRKWIDSRLDSIDMRMMVRFYYVAITGKAHPGVKSLLVKAG